MPNSYFQFKQFTILQDRCSMKVTTDSCLFGAWVADRIHGEQTIENILDIGSGTGLLSLMLAQKTKANIDAIELQESDYLQSIENIASSPWEERINMIHGDVALHQPRKKYDVIISNPPFYENDLKSDNKTKNIAHHDETLTLKKLVAIIEAQISPGGKFYILLPSKRKDDFFRVLETSKLHLSCITNLHQTDKHDAFRIMAEGSFEKAPFKKDKLTIKSGNVYSEEFSQLLKDYYLYL